MTPIEQLTVPAMWDSSLANPLPGHRIDHLMPLKIQASNAKHHKSGQTLTEVKTQERDAA
jgi:hypothetical protein